MLQDQEREIKALLDRIDVLEVQKRQQDAFAHLGIIPKSLSSDDN